MPSIPGAILPKLKPVGRISTVLRGSIVNPFAFGALQMNGYPSFSFFGHG
jgi:hypothetical protein